MPIIIRELNIRVSVNRNQREEDDSPPGQETPASMPGKDEIIAECVEQVMELLKLQKER